MSDQSFPMYDKSFAGKLDDFKVRVDLLLDRAANIPDALTEVPALIKEALAYKKVGGLHFAKFAGASVSWSFKRKEKAAKPAAIEADESATIAPDLFAARMALFVK